MSTVQLFAGSEHYKKVATGAVVTIGNFDGVHLGHQELLKNVIKCAQTKQINSCVFTFEPSPRTLLSKKNKSKRIGRWADKVKWLEELGVEQIILEPFSIAFAQHSAEWFVEEILIKRLKTQVLFVGHDFRFGRARSGDVLLIKRLAPHIQVHQLSAFKMQEQIVSSSLIRELISRGKVARAAELLGRPHMVHGVVVGGDQRGRKIGFPTANIESDTEILPAAGVYLVSLSINVGEQYWGMANLGIQPTFGENKFRIEVNIFDFNQSIYGADINIYFLEYMRSEQYFASVDQLKTQLLEDETKARQALQKYKLLKST